MAEVHSSKNRESQLDLEVFGHRINISDPTINFDGTLVVEVPITVLSQIESSASKIAQALSETEEMRKLYEKLYQKNLGAQGRGK